MSLWRPLQIQTVIGTEPFLDSSMFLRIYAGLQRHSPLVCTRPFQPAPASMAIRPTVPLCLFLVKVVAHKLGLHPELVGYFGLFLIQCFPEGKLSGKMKKGEPRSWKGVSRDLALGCGKYPQRDWLPFRLRSLLLSSSLDQRLKECTQV